MFNTTAWDIFKSILRKNLNEIPERFWGIPWEILEKLSEFEEISKGIAVCINEDREISETIFESISEKILISWRIFLGGILEAISEEENPWKVFKEYLENFGRTAEAITIILGI